MNTFVYRKIHDDRTENRKRHAGMRQDGSQWAVRSEYICGSYARGGADCDDPCHLSWYSDSVVLMNSMIRILKNMSMTFYSTEPKTHTHKRISSRIDRMMEDTYRRLVDRTRDYPVFTMGKGRLEAMEAFRKSGNGVLLASDSAGEGIDLAGDILAALPDMPVTDQIGDVGSFILDHKGKSYFRRAQGIGQGEELI